MSFNNNDNNALQITRANYEEYFLLYVDNELTKEEKQAVEAFLALHPDLQAEMDILLGTKLPLGEASGLEDKGFLMADQMKLVTIDESLLLYIDNELNKEEKEKLEVKIAADKEFRLQHEALLKTKLDPSEVIAYPYKKELYRHSERRITPFWLRVAAAVLILLGMGAAWMWNNRQAEQPGTAIATTPVKKDPASTTEKAIEQSSTPVKEDEVITHQEKPAEEKADKAPVLAKHKTIDGSERSVASKEAKTPEKIVPEVKNNNLPVPVTEEIKEPVLAAIEPEAAPQQSINNPSVTTVSTSPYNNKSTDPTLAVAVEKKASLKGLLRKATRFIERRTNISATNENDELVIGAVALKL